MDNLRATWIAPWVCAAALLTACGDGTFSPDFDQGPGSGTDMGGTGPDLGFNPGLPVGSPCTADLDCSGPAPQCIIAELAPLAQLATSTHPGSQELAVISVPLAGNYCSNTAPCTSDAQCGDGGVCFRPLADVDPLDYEAALDVLNLTPDGPLPAADRALLEGFAGYGQCMQPCSSDTDCTRPGYTCQVPINDFISLVPNARLESYCIGDGTTLDCSTVDCGTNGTCDDSSGAPVCNCAAGWSGALCDMPIVCPAYTATDANLVVDNPAATAWGDTVMFSCNAGYAVTGGTAVTCGDGSGATGAWAGTEPTCQLVTCDSGSIPGTANGSGSATGSGAGGAIVVGDMATYTCSMGFTLGGPGNVTCGSTGSWEGTPPTCSAGTCSPLSAPNNGGATPSGAGVGDTTTFSCNSGYTLQVGGMPHGMSTYVRTCQDEGGGSFDWDGTQPTCQIVDCGAAPTISNGSRTPTGTTFGSTADYSCNSGYVRSGPAQTSCQANGTWETPPSCDPVDCGPPPAAGTDATLTPPANNLLGAMATYSCVGMQVPASGPSSVTCLPSGSWSDTVGLSCEDPPVTCTPTSCANGGTCVEVMGVFDSCDCSTATGYTGATCSTPIDCGMPPGAGANATLDSSTGTSFMDTATYACNSGYNPSGGQATVTCSANMSNMPFWNGTPLSCSPVTCANPPGAPTNGGVSGSGNTFGSMRSFSCDPGYILMGAMSSTCEASGNWSNPTPTCVIDSSFCPTAPAATSNAMLDSNSGRAIGDTAVYSCNTGYNQSGGNTTRTCVNSGGAGVWSGSNLTCSIVTCSNPPGAPANGGVSGSGNTYNSTRSFTCNMGYTLSGSATSTCQANGNWSSGTPTCNPVNCGTPSLTNGTAATPSGTTFGDPVNYSCDMGYMLNGPSSGSCDAMGSWGAAPTCDPAPSTCTLVYDFGGPSSSDSRFRIQPSFGATTVNIGQGRMIVRVPSNAMNQPIDGTAELLYYEMDQFFGPVSGVTTETRVCLMPTGTSVPTVSPSSPPPEQEDMAACLDQSNTTAMATGSFTASGGSGTINFSCYTPPPTAGGYTPSQATGTAAGCMQTWLGYGRVYCQGGQLCGFALPTNQWLDRTDSWSQHFLPISLSSNLSSLTMGNTGGGSSTSAWAHVPNTDNGWTGFALVGSLNTMASTCSP